MQNIQPHFVLLIAFFLGSIPTGYLIGRFYFGVDLRKMGSGNTGATNAGRMLSKKAGLITLALDALKGALAVCLPSLLLGWPLEFAAFSGLLAILGHCYSPFLNFQGGKGVATSLGAFAVLMPTGLLCSIAAFAAVVYLTRIVSLGSLAAAIVLIAYAYEQWPTTVNGPTVFAAVTAAALTVYRHKTNIQRLLAGTEPKFNASS